MKKFRENKLYITKLLVVPRVAGQRLYCAGVCCKALQTLLKGHTFVGESAIVGEMVGEGAFSLLTVNDL